MKVYLAEPISDVAYKLLSDHFEITDSLEHPEELDGMLIRCAPVTRELIEKAVKLKIISEHGTGVDSIDVKAAEEHGIKVTNTPGLNAQSVAELAVSFILSLSRKIKYVDKGLQKGSFTRFGQPDLIGNEVSGKKLGIIGCGNIANKVATIMKTAFNAQVYCWNPRRSTEYISSLGYKKIESIKELLSICDFVSVHIPLTDETKNLITEKEFETANPNLILVNTARAGIVNEKDLYNALIMSKIKAAACDVFESEIPSQDNPLLALDNFTGTLHIGASTTECLGSVGLASVQNLIDYLKP